MRAVLEALNSLVAQGIIREYAIGGAIGASFYIDALQTEDVDAFVFLPISESPLVSLTPVYNALQSLGGVLEREHVRFGEWPLQILTDANDLIAEAIASATSVEFEDEPTRVFGAEYLCAIALQTGRQKDYWRVHLFLERGAVDIVKLSALTKRFGLETQLERVMNLPK